RWGRLCGLRSRPGKRLRRGRLRREDTEGAERTEKDQPQRHRDTEKTRSSWRFAERRISLCLRVSVANLSLCAHDTLSPPTILSRLYRSRDMGLAAGARLAAYESVGTNRRASATSMHCAPRRWPTSAPPRP